MMSNFPIIIFATLMIASVIYCHGRMDDPPSRNSAWRFLPGFPQDREDYNLAHSFGIAICGSNAHAYGGTYATGKITKTYEQGDIITIHSYIWINHGGPIQMSICPVPNEFSNVEATQACFDLNKLAVVNGTLSGNDIYKSKLAGNEKNYYHSVKLPDDLVCDRCVLQWKWFAVNTGEIFTNCADIQIKAKPTTASLSSSTRRIIARRTSTPILTTTTTSVTENSKPIKFVCSKAIPPPRTPRNGLYAYVGSAVICFWVDKTSPIDCDYCKDYCLSKEFECPIECDCRWYA